MGEQATTGAAAMAVLLPRPEPDVPLPSYGSAESGIHQSVLGSRASACALLIELRLLDQSLDLFIPPPGRAADITRHHRALWMHVEAGRGK